MPGHASNEVEHIKCVVRDMRDCACHCRVCDQRRENRRLDRERGERVRAKRIERDTRR